jgi:hypothetical protein
MRHGEDSEPLSDPRDARGVAAGEVVRERGREGTRFARPIALVARTAVKILPSTMIFAVFSVRASAEAIRRAVTRENEDPCL